MLFLTPNCHFSPHWSEEPFNLCKMFFLQPLYLLVRALLIFWQTYLSTSCVFVLLTYGHLLNIHFLPVCSTHIRALPIKHSLLCFFFSTHIRALLIETYPLLACLLSFCWHISKSAGFSTSICEHSRSKCIQLHIINCAEIAHERFFPCFVLWFSKMNFALLLLQSRKWPALLFSSLT